MNKYLVMTSINSPTIAVEKYAVMKDYRVVMIGDKKTPENWQHKNVIYLSPDQQEKLSYSIIKYLPWNIPARVNIGYLYAIEHSAEIITQSDDDNIPNEHWGIPHLNDEVSTINANDFINVYKYFTDSFVWPRGFPLDRILEQKVITEQLEPSQVRVWQHLANRDTDVDAIYRLTNNKFIYFSQRSPLALKEGSVCPFNCQSTTFYKEAFLLLYLPSFISPRASDIVRGLIAQPLLWSIGRTLGFTAPTVIQERNPHNYLDDFRDELLIYLESENIFNIAKSMIRSEASLSENLFSVYQGLIKARLVPEKELDLVRAWISDVNYLISKH
jgi:hypothetical protein